MVLMKFKIEDLPHTGQFFTTDQFMAFLEGQKCSHCDKRARWLPMEKGIGYCDEHYPYKESDAKMEL